jgi:hypothetical protein
VVPKPRIRSILRRELIQFKGELAEDRRRDGRQHSEENIGVKDGRWIEPHAESKPTEALDLCEPEALQFIFPCRNQLADSSFVVSEKGRASMRTGSAGCDCEVFKGTRTPVQYMLGVNSREVPPVPPIES